MKLSKEDYIVIKTLKNRGVYLKDIAEELGVLPVVFRLSESYYAIS